MTVMGVIFVFVVIAIGAALAGDISKINENMRNLNPEERARARRGDRNCCMAMLFVVGVFAAAIALAR